MLFHLLWRPLNPWLIKERESYLKTCVFRAAKPVLTMYVCVESMQDSSTMKEYQAVYLETLTLKALKEKLAQKCNLQSIQISAVFR